jgi:hypothetical protein
MDLLRAALLTAAVAVAGPASAGELFPFSMPWNDIGDGGVTDLSGWNDKPAGAQGFVSVDGSHLAAGGKRLKFLGVNIVFGSTAPSHDEADVEARRLARFGVNIVRFHHMDSAPAPRGVLQKDGRTLDPDTMDRLDYFIAALKREGVYADLNLHVGRMYPGMGEIWPDGPQYWKGVDLFAPAMIDQQKDYARALLTHRNPYTGAAYVDEPAVAIVEINNENGLIRQWQTGSLDGMTEPFRGELTRQWQAWLKRRYADDAALRTAWGVRSEPLGEEMLAPGVGVRSADKGWTLQTIGAAKATLAGTAPSGFTLALDKPGQESWHIQLHQNGLAFEAERPYTLTLRLRADHPIALGVMAMQAHAPWARLWSDTIKAGAAWQDVTLTFAPPTGDSVARLTLGQLGFETGRLEIAGASLKPGGTVGLRPGESLERGAIPIVDFASRLSRTAAAQRDWLAFLWDVEDGYWSGMRRFVKDELGARSLIVGTQVSYSPAPIQAGLDVIDGHAYWQHPRFPGKPWDIDNWTIGDSPMAGVDGGGALADLALRRAPGKPFIVTEYNHPAPSLYQGEALPLAAAYGALQDWDGLFLYSYGAHDQQWRGEFINNFFDSHGNPVKMASFLASAALLRRADVSPAEPRPAATPDRAAFIEALRREAKMPGADDFGAPRDAALRNWVSAATPAGPSPLSPIKSETGELVWGLDGVGGKTVTIDAKRSKGLIGARLGHAFEAHGVGLELTEARNDWGVLLATVIDGEDFSSPGRILVTALGQEENTGQRWLDAKKTSVGRNFGAAPVLVEGVGARLSLPVEANRVSAWTLDERGRRRDPLPVGGADRATVELGERYRTLWYEIDIQ